MSFKEAENIHKENEKCSCCASPQIIKINKVK
jgi:hypothetical protein